MSDELNSLRKRIDKADRRLLEALARRMKVVDEILEEKESRGLPLFDAARETDLLTRMARWARQKDLDPVLAERVLKEVINHSREVQSSESSQGTEPRPHAGSNGRLSGHQGRLLVADLSEALWKRGRGDRLWEFR